MSESRLAPRLPWAVQRQQERQPPLSLLPLAALLVLLRPAQAPLHLLRPLRRHCQPSHEGMHMALGRARLLLQLVAQRAAAPRLLCPLHPLQRRLLLLSAPPQRQCLAAAA